MDTDELHSAYRTMMLIRRFEELVVGLVNSNEIAGVTHEYVGQEAVATGICAALQPDDVLTSTHRGHGHLLARGADPAAMLAELLGRETGLNRGRGGSMHIADVALGVYGANGIVGAGVPFALGATSVSLSDGQRVAVAFFGDGAINQGVLLESLNLAAAWKLPVVFCCENNHYAVTMPISRSATVTPAERAAGFGITALTVDGMDVEAVNDAAKNAIEWARTGKGPYFLDLECYRFLGHHTAEATMNLKYRSGEEIAQWKKRDPLDATRRRLLELGMTSDQLDLIDRVIQEDLNTALDNARDGQRPKPESALDFMYASPTATRWGSA